MRDISRRTLLPDAHIYTSTHLGMTTTIPNSSDQEHRGGCNDDRDCASVCGLVPTRPQSPVQPLLKLAIDQHERVILNRALASWHSPVTLGREIARHEAELQTYKEFATRSTQAPDESRLLEMKLCDLELCDLELDALKRVTMPPFRFGPNTSRTNLKCRLAELL